MEKVTTAHIRMRSNRQAKPPTEREALRVGSSQSLNAVSVAIKAEFKFILMCGECSTRNGVAEAEIK